MKRSSTIVIFLLLTLSFEVAAAQHSIPAKHARLNSGEIVPQYGLGLGLTPFRGRKRFGHNGGGGLGFATSFTYFPAEKISVVLLSNADQPGGRIGDLANEIAAMYF